MAVFAAVLNSPELDRSTASLQDAEANLLAVRTGRKPSVTFGASPTGPDSFSSVGTVSVAQLVFDGGVSRARTTAEKARVLGGMAGRIDAAAQAAMKATQAWADVATTRAILRETETSLLEMEKTLQKIEEKARTGLTPLVELLSARSSLANERSKAVSAQAEVVRAQSVFLEVFGFEPSHTIQLPPEALQRSSEGLENAPILLQLEAALLAAEADYAAALAARLPSVSLTASILTKGGATGGVSSSHLMTPTGARRAAVDAAAARIEARRTELDATKREIESRLRILTAESLALRLQVEAARQAAEATTASLEAAGNQFQVGSASLNFLLELQREALNSKRDRLLKERDQILVGYRLLSATGEINDLFGIEIENAKTAGEKN